MSTVTIRIDYENGAASTVDVEIRRLFPDENVWEMSVPKFGIPEGATYITWEMPSVER